MKIAVIGSGSWGTALSQVLCDNQHDVLLYGRNSFEVDDINQNHQNSTYFKEVLLNQNLKATNDFNDLKGFNIYLLAVPTIAIETICKQITSIATNDFLIINTAKGFHPQTFKRMSEVIEEAFTDNSYFQGIISLIGPSHAEEVVLRMYTAINAVCDNEQYAKQIQQLFANNYLRVYTNTDVVGAEYGVALKNAIALASGMISGLGYGDNTKAALITRGLAEMSRFGMKMGGRMETYLGLCGLGDLIVTCTSIHSRNFQAGYAIGKANSAKEFLETNIKTVEGINTVNAVYSMAKEVDIEMPIVNQLYTILYQNAKPSDCIDELMNRKLISEI